MKTDRVSGSARQAEREIDGAISAHPLLRLPFGTAAWYLLSEVEFSILQAEAFNELSYAEFDAITQNAKNSLQYALLFALRNCPPGGGPPKELASSTRLLARELSKMTRDYVAFVEAYVYGSWGYLKLDADHGKKSLLPEFDFPTHAVYEAYDRIVSVIDGLAALPQINRTVVADLYARLPDRIRFDRDALRVKTNPKVVNAALAYLREHWGRQYALPDDWSFTQYTIGDFKLVFSALAALCTLHHLAVAMAASEIGISEGNLAIWYQSGLLIHPLDDLRTLVRRYSGASERSVNAILGDLTYGGAGIREPDPALQPLIMLNDKVVCVSPLFITTSAPERNLIVLLNRIPREREVYQTLTNEKEELMRGQLAGSADARGWRHWTGRIAADLPNIDLAIVDDRTATCLITELKWFIAPAEPREIIEKSREVDNGISQIRTLRKALVDDRIGLDRLRINPGYTIVGVVVSENSIGMGWEQDRSVPVVNKNHLLRRFAEGGELLDIVKWLETRQYLPVEGKDFTVLWRERHVADWRLDWYYVGLRSDLGAQA